MKQNIKSLISRNLTNARGWRTDRKIIVFESDDWGSIRTSSKEVQKDFIKKGYNITQCPYNLNDRLESNMDLESLGETLLSMRDGKGNPAKFTINNIVSNPDFEKIEQSGFTKYYLEPFTKSLQRYNDSSHVMELYKEGIAKNIFHPQLHGREHVNLRLWFKRLQENDSKTIDAFQAKMFTVHKSGPINGRRDNLDTFGNASLKGENYDYTKSIPEAQRLFDSIWGYKSKSFIAPCYVWHPSLEETLLNEGIYYIQGSRTQRVPIDNHSFNVKKKTHFTGQKNKWNQTYLVRNCFFEPSESRKPNIIENTLREIKSSFFFRKPAIISSHRVNYIGSLNSQNRSRNLKLLKELFHEILKRWPMVEFMSSDQLGEIITNKNKCVE